MTIKFYKYQGAGNDFVMVHTDTPNPFASLTTTDIKKICDRNFGVGADGFIVLQSVPDYDFEMIYYNSDGNISTMCGNGGRCAVAFARQIKLIGDTTRFLAIDGPHEATFVDDNVSLSMKDVADIQQAETFYQLDTGSPHYITFVENVQDIKVAQEGRLIRNSPRFAAAGINVNFVEVKKDDALFMRTYERGVENETLSCGTGVTAAALVQMMRSGLNHIAVETLGGKLSVQATKNKNGFEDIRLIGPAEFVFSGEYTF